MNIAVILAGGSGSRFGAGKPKQYIEVLGKPVLAYTIEAFQKHAEIDAVEIVCAREWEGYVKDMVRAYHFSKVKWYARGGSTFQESVMNGINYLEQAADEDDILLVHYAASPFVSSEIISDAIRVCRKKGNCVSATPCFLLMGSNDDGMRSTTWVDRDRLMQLNSPQSFQYGYVRRLYERAVKEGLLAQVEPHTTSLMYKMGETIYFSKGNQTNIKITTKEDLELFKGWVLVKEDKK